MCGRYASTRKRIELLEEFSVQRDRVAEPLEARLQRRADQAGLRGAGPGEPAAADEPQRCWRPAALPLSGELRVVRWGLVPFWAKDISIGSRMINARAETVAEKPAFRQRFRQAALPAPGRRLLRMAAAAGRATGAKQPYLHHPRRRTAARLRRAVRAVAGPPRAEDDPDAWLWTATIITTSAPDELGMIHDRMPMVIDPASWADWLDPGQ